MVGDITGGGERGGGVLGRGGEEAAMGSVARGAIASAAIGVALGPDEDSGSFVRCAYQVNTPISTLTPHNNNKTERRERRKRRTKPEYPNVGSKNGRDPFRAGDWTHIPSSLLSTSAVAVSSPVRNLGGDETVAAGGDTAVAAGFEEVSRVGVAGRFGTSFACCLPFAPFPALVPLSVGSRDAKLGDWTWTSAGADVGVEAGPPSAVGVDADAATSVVGGGEGGLDTIGVVGAVVVFDRTFVAPNFVFLSFFFAFLPAAVVAGVSQSSNGSTAAGVEREMSASAATKLATTGLSADLLFFLPLILMGLSSSFVSRSVVWSTYEMRGQSRNDRVKNWGNVPSSHRHSRSQRAA